MKISGINRCILKYLLEIIIVLIIVIFSYVGLVNNNLSSYAAIASNNTSIPRGLDILYEKDYEDTLAILENSNLLDSGTLYVENPNNFVLKTKIKLKIKMPEYIKNSLEFKINDKKLDNSKFTFENGIYTYVIETKYMESLDSEVYDFKICGDALYTDVSSINYYFEVAETMYS